MKNIAAFCFLMFLLNPVFAQKAKLSPQTRQYLLHSKNVGGDNVLPSYIYKTGPDNTLYIGALIKAGSVQEPQLQGLGIKIGTKAGDIWTLQVPVAAVEAFTNVAGIEYIELDQPVFPNLDTARVLTRVDSVHAGINLPMPYTGKDVVVGIIDAGFDYSQVACFDTSGTIFRLKKVWEQKKPGIPPSQYFYGNELSTSTSMFSAKTDAFGFSHGAHVAGIAGGSGFGSDNTQTRFRGMAYESDLVFVGITPPQDEWMNTGLSDVVDALSYIFSYATINGKPAVANLSWGCSVGPHDGTSLFSQACDNLTGPGKIFVCSGGNNGTNNIHLTKTFTATDTVVNTVLNLPDVQGQKRAWIDAWGDSASSFCLQASLTNGSTILTTIGSYCSNDTNNAIYDLYLIGQNNDTCFITITTDSATFNGKPRIFLDVYNKTNDQFLITLRSTGSKVHMWTGYVKNKTGYYGSFLTSPNFLPTLPGNTMSTISDISSTKSAIAVAAYASNTAYTNILGNNVSYTWYVNEGNIAPFSSFGPTADGRVKPDISAPGLVIGSAVNSYDTTYALTTGTGYPSVVTSYYKQQNNRTYQYAMLMGTSMSAPVAAGIVALMLQVSDTLTPDGVKSILKQTAIKDNFTGSIPSSGSNTWGHGKINAYRAILEVLPVVGVEVVATTGEQLPCILYPNPNKGQYNIDYNAEKDDHLQLEVYNVSGSAVLSRNWMVKAGTNTTSVDLQSMPPGIYFSKISSGKGSVVIKMNKE